MSPASNLEWGDYMREMLRECYGRIKKAGEMHCFFLLRAAAQATLLCPRCSAYERNGSLLQCDGYAIPDGQDRGVEVV